MNAHQFAEKWRKSTLKESAGYIPHFEDICRLVDHETPTDADSSGSGQGRGGVGPAANPPEWSPTDAELKKRTLTNLYTERPTWLRLAHERLDAAVFAAYGWDPGIADGEVLAQLPVLNLEGEAV